MSLLEKYEERTAWKYDPLPGRFLTHPDLGRKIKPDGGYAPFAGTTVFFRPDKNCLGTVLIMKRLLDRRLGDLLAAPLPDGSFHMTLHDLVSPENSACDPADGEAYRREMRESLEKAAGIAESLRRESDGRPIRMIADRVVNMVSKSLVLMLRPASEDDYGRLLKLYRCFEGVTGLPYPPLTPHITLGYYRPGPEGGQRELDGARMNGVLERMQILPDRAPVFDFYPESLTAAAFDSMARYHEIPERVCFCCDGGLNRSVMAACLLNHEAKKKRLPIRAGARAAFPVTRGAPVPDEVLRTLEKHGIRPGAEGMRAEYLGAEDLPRFTRFAGISHSAFERFDAIGLTEDRVLAAFDGVPDPAYDDTTYESVFEILRERVRAFLDEWVRGVPGWALISP